jgi:16S rRNA (guanine527-N7)-methyltransferase
MREPQIAEVLRDYGVTSTPELSQAIDRYMDLLMHWNRRVSLTALMDPERILRFHFGESLFALKAALLESGRLADVGSGAGFPGLAIKLVRPQIDVTLLESNKKKCVFLEEVTRELGLTSVRVIQGNYTDYSSPESAALDFITSRALGNFEALVSWSRRVIASQGRLMLWLNLQDAKRVSRMPGFLWGAPLLIPRTKGRFLLMGRSPGPA